MQKVFDSLLQVSDLSINTWYSRGKNIDTGHRISH